MTQPAAPDIKAGLDLARVRAAIAPVLSAHGVVLVDLEWETDRAGWVLRLTIEREGADYAAGFGVTLDDCAEVSRDTSSLLDVQDLVPHHYHLEVSSPGLDRPLRGPADFARFAGQTAKVKLSRPAPDGQRLLRGTLAEAPEGQVAVVVDGKRIEVPFADVAEANLVFELSPQPKKNTAKQASRGPKKATRSS
jgi:ribosome maturation factor RimP